MATGMTSLYSSFGGGPGLIPGSPKHTKGLTLSTAQLHANDIDVYEWLAELDMGMYAECFLANFGVNDTNFLNRKHLMKVRLQDLPKMGITQYHHAKLIHDHIHHSLQYEFGSPVRKKQVDKKMRDLFPDKYPDIEHVPKKVGRLKVEDLHIPQRTVERARSNAHLDHKKISKQRRRSFDKQVWQNIHHLRSTDVSSANASEGLRDGDYKQAEAMESKAQEVRRRRSFDHNNDAKNFGDRALHSDLIHRELNGLQRAHIKGLRAMIGCEKAYISFLHEKSRELVLLGEHGKWYRLAEDLSIPGHCAANGIHMNVSDCDSDSRFNSNLDEKLGIVSKECLCYPLRDNKGAGKVVGVMMLVNKKDGFDLADEDTVANVVQRIAEDLFMKFKELNEVASIMAGSATFIMHKGGESRHKKTSPDKAHYLVATEDSEGHKTHAVETSSEVPFHFGMDVTLGLEYGRTH